MRAHGLGTIGLGTDWGGILQAGTGLVTTLVGSKQADQNNASLERQMQLQLQAQQQALQAQQTQQASQAGLMKTVLIGVGGLIVLGTAAYLIVR